MKLSMPLKNITGSMVSVANANRKNTTCATPSVLPVYFIITSLPTPMS